MNSSNNADENIFDLEVQRSDFFVLLEQCRKKREFTDVQLQIGDKLFDAHRNILSLYSPVLKAMISDQWSTTKVCPISEEYVDVEIVEDLLNFLYTGKIKLTPGNVQPICMAAHFLQIPTLLQPSVQHLCKLITVENAFPLFRFAVTCQLATLGHSCLRVIPKNNGVILQKPETVDFSKETFIYLIVGLKEQCWTTKLRENIFHCIVRWTEKNLFERSDELPVLLKNIPLEQLSLKFLSETVFVHPLVKRSISCIETVSAALANYQPAPTDGFRKDQNLIAYGYDPETKRSCLTCYDPQTDVWTKLPEMLAPRFEFAATVVNGRDIVVCGGYSEYGNQSTTQLNSVEMFDWSLKTWKKLPSMSLRLGCCSIATLNGHLYVVGSGNLGRMSTFLCYSFGEQEWKNVKQMNVPRNSGKLVEYNNHLYVFGGGKPVVEKYNPLSDEWTSITSSEMNERIIHAAEYRGKFFARRYRNFGGSGFNNFFDFRMFDPETGVWTSFTETLTPSNFVSMNGRLLAVMDYRANDKWIYEFEISTQNWRQFCKMDTELRNPRLIAGIFESPFL